MKSGFAGGIFGRARFIPPFVPPFRCRRDKVHRRAGQFLHAEPHSAVLYLK